VSTERPQDAGVGDSRLVSASATAAPWSTDVAIRRWNWGAFAFTWFWGLFNGARRPLFGLLLALVPSVDLWRRRVPGEGSVWMSTGTLLLAAWSVYCGIMGDRWAWKGGRWQDFAQFRRAQRGWAIATLVLAAVLAATATVVLAVASAGLTD
jgi:hypothetical protein